MMTQPPDSIHWRRNAPATISFIQRHWLFRPGALTAGLRRLGNVRLQVVREYSWGATPEDAVLLHRPAGTPVWVREVAMDIDGVPAVVARSLVPLQASHSWWRGMRGLGSRPLADLLYHNPQISRSDFLVSLLQKHQNLHATVRYAAGPFPAAGAQRLLARCSVFWRTGQPLVVAECFLPEFWNMTDKQPKW